MDDTVQAGATLLADTNQLGEELTLATISLPDRWYELCSSVNIHDTNKAVLKKILNGYGEPGRTYHNQQHLLAVLARLDQLAETAQAEALRLDVPFQTTAVYFAAFFHDL